MSWTGLVAGIAIGGLGAYFLRAAPSLAEDERVGFRLGERMLIMRRWSYGAAGLFLLVCGAVLAVGSL